MAIRSFFLNASMDAVAGREVSLERALDVVRERISKAPERLTTDWKNAPPETFGFFRRLELDWIFISVLYRDTAHVDVTVPCPDRNWWARFMDGASFQHSRKASTLADLERRVRQYFELDPVALREALKPELPDIYERSGKPLRDHP